jgi:UDP-galactopyranose mutase
MFARADLVFTGGHSLYEAKRGRHSNIHPFPSSVDVPHFRKARAGGAEPPEHAGLGRPRLGFFGVIDERMNLELLDHLAHTRSDWQIVMIGPVVKIDAGALPQRPNLHWIGSKRYEELPAYLAGWDLGIMPFAINEATRYISPTKTPEFLAAGLPVVSTPITDVVRSYGSQGLVEIADDAIGFAERCEAILARPRKPWLAAVDRHLAALSWDETWARMAEHMKSARRAKPSRSAYRPATNMDDARV